MCSVPIGEKVGLLCAVGSSPSCVSFKLDIYVRSFLQLAKLRREFPETFCLFCYFRLKPAKGS